MSFDDLYRNDRPNTTLQTLKRGVRLLHGPMRFKVIDTIDFKSSWIHRYPEIEARGEGVMAILDPVQIQVTPEIKGRTVMICLPDGNVKPLLASDAELHHSVVGIFFKGASSEDIPRGAELQW